MFVWDPDRKIEKIINAQAEIAANEAEKHKEIVREIIQFIAES